MIVFEIDWENGDNRKIWWLSSVFCTDDDEEHDDEIYEQLTVEDSHLEDL